MNKSLYSVAIICILLVALSVGYYFSIYLPKSNAEKREGVNAQQLLENNIKCRELGTKTHNEEVKDLDEMNKNPLMDTYYVYEPEFRFNESLNTCLYKGGNKMLFETLFVKDLYTNSDIARWSHSSGRTVSGIKEEYDEAVAKYFSKQ